MSIIDELSRTVGSKNREDYLIRTQALDFALRIPGPPSNILDFAKQFEKFLRGE